MSRLRTSLAPFALVTGRRRNHTDSVIYREPTRWSSSPATHLYLLAEHGTVPGYDHELGHIVMDEVRLVFAAEERLGRSTPVALANALKAVNAAMWEEGQALPPQRRIPIGLVAAAIVGSEAYLCQIGSGQVLVSRRDQIVSLPTLGFWHALYASDTTANVAMGQTADLQPAISRCHLRPGDRLLLCCSNLARLLDETVLAEVSHQPIETAIGRLYALAEEFGLQQTSGLTIDIEQIAGRPSSDSHLSLERLTADEMTEDGLVADGGGLISRLRDLLGRPRLTPRSPAAPQSTPTADPAPVAAETMAHAEHLPDNVVRLYMTPPLAPPVELAPSEAIALADERPVAMAVGETPRASYRETPPWVAARHPSRWLDILSAPLVLASESLRRAPMPAMAGAGGSASLPLQSDLSQEPDEVEPEQPRRRARRRLQPGWSSLTMQIAAILAIVTGALLVAIFVTSFLQPRQPAIVSTAAATSGETARPTGETPIWRPADWPVSERSQPAPVAASQPVTPPDTVITDQTNRITRIAAPTVLADLSSSGSPASTPKQIVVGSNGLYVLDPHTSTLYLIDQNGKEIVPLLAKGWTIGRQKVTDLIGITWRGDTLVALDRERVYTMDGPNGTWRMAPLAAASFGLGVRPVSSFEGNLYLLDTTNRQVFKFAQGAYAKPPQRWLRAPERVDLANAVDIAIDGRIYALTTAGQIVSMLRGEVEKQITPEVTPALQTPVAMISPPGSSYLYVAEASGRILKLTKEGGLVRQFLLPEGVGDLTGLTDLTINEATSSIYAAVGNRIYRLTIPTGETNRPATPLG